MTRREIFEFCRIASLAGFLLVSSARAQEPDTAAAAPAGPPRVAVSVSVEGEGGKVTEFGTFVIELRSDDAPQHVESFLKLVDEGYYVGTTFHRIVPGFIVQGGDPVSRLDWKSPSIGVGGPAYAVPAEVRGKHVRGAVAAGRNVDASKPAEGLKSQFYICLADLPALDRGGYTVFGQVVEGMDVVDKIARIKNAGSENQNRALQRVWMTSVSRVTG